MTVSLLSATDFLAFQLHGCRHFTTITIITIMSKFSSVSDKFNFSEEELKILDLWSRIDAFQTSLKLSEGRPEYTFYDGPPFATGLPHYG
jgi:hypothetical protein